MPSKLDSLRQGGAVEVRPGLSARLNKETKQLELSSGRVIDVGDDPDYFPPNEQALNVSKQREYAEKRAKGPIGEFVHQYTNQGIVGGVTDLPAYITQSGEDYIARKQGQQKVSERISEESPITSGLATGASIGTDLLATRGMSALKAAPLITTASAGSKIFTEPQEVAKDAIMAAGAGYVADKAVSGLGKIAKRRGEIRALPEQQQAVTNRNLLGQQATKEANAVQTQEYNLLKQETKGINESRLKAHEEKLLERQNKMLADQNDYLAQKNARDEAVLKLKNQAELDKATNNANKLKSENEYKLAKEAAEKQEKINTERFKSEQAQYQETLKQLPEIQRQAQAEYSANVVRNAERIADAFPRESKIYSSQFGTKDFIDSSIQKSGLAGTKEANQASKILRSIFPEGEILTSRELSSRYRALESAIQKSSPEVRQVLNEFKTHVGGKLNTILADNMAYSKIIPSLQKEVSKDVQTVLNQMQLVENGMMSRSFLKKRAENNINQMFREITPEDFMRKFQDGEIHQLILKNTIRPDDFVLNLNALKPGKRKILPTTSEEIKKWGLELPTAGKYNEFETIFSKKLDKQIAKANMKMIATDIDAAKKLGGNVRQTFGLAEPVSQPNLPNAPEPIPQPQPPSPIEPVPPIQYPPNAPRPQAPPLPNKPDLLPSPNAPIPQTFNPEALPTLPPAQGMAENAGDLLEKKLLGGNTLMNNPITKLGALKYVAGKGAIPLEAGYLGMKGLTSPTQAGEVARASFKQAGISAIESWAQKYPSYHDGIIENPMERRSLTKEIEDDPEIPLEQKAVIQSKINRGKPLQQRL